MDFLSYTRRKWLPLFEEDGAGGGAGADPAGDPAGSDGAGDGSKPATFEDTLKANPDFQSELDRRINKAVETATKNERERQKIIQDTLQDEVLRVSKMTQAEKDAYFKQKAEKEAADKEATLTERELRLDARSALQEKHLPESFIDLLAYSNKDACLKSIDVLDSAFREAVQAAVDQKLKGSAPPKDAKTEGKQPSGTESYDKALAEAAAIAGVQLKK